MTNDIAKALTLLEADGVVGLPTETVYGLAARIDRPAGLRRIFSTKERPFFDPLIVHVASIPQARLLASEWPAQAQILAETFWPGPLTLIVPKSSAVDDVITSGLTAVGLRCPDHPVALELIRGAGVPLAAPSANKFGRTSPTTAEHVRAEFGTDVFVLDGGPSRVGIESTVLAIQPRGDRVVLSILRAGMITQEMISKALEEKNLPAIFDAVSDKRTAPGQMKHHYMPSVPLIWIEGSWTDEQVASEANRQLARMPDNVEGVKIRKPTDALSKPARLILPDDPALAARELYSDLRRLAETGADHLIYQHDPRHKGAAWDGILDRLEKATSLMLRRNPGIFA